jgi:hypothetical protein
LSKIPLIGWLFKRRRKAADKTDLTVFITPTIILPRTRGGISQYTKDYVQLAQRYSAEAELFDGLRDPITRFFFASKINLEDEVNEFLDDDRELFKELAIGEQKPNEYAVPPAMPAHIAPPTTTPAPATSAPQVVVEATPPAPATPVTVAVNTKTIAQAKTDPLQALLAEEENPLLKSKSAPAAARAA